MTSGKEDEYILKNIAQNALSDECHTPGSLPRITQPTYGKYLTRIDARDDYINQEEVFHPSIVEKWIKIRRHLWVEHPAKNAYFIYDMFKKYTVPNLNYNPKKRFQLQLFPRPYNCELDYITTRRKLANYKDEEEIFCKLIEKYVENEMERKCQILPPFWWKQPEIKKETDKDETSEFDKKDKFKEIRWRPIPNPVMTSNMTCCERKEAISMVGYPFRHEACSFYNEHFPPPKMIFVKNSFSK